MADKKRKNTWFFTVGLILTAFMVTVILIGQFWTPYDPNQMSGSEKMQGPSLHHIFGTDNFGRDIFSRVIQGAGATFLIAAAAVAIGLVLANLMNIGAGFTMPTTDIAYDAKEIPSVVDTLMQIVPTNPFAALAEQNLLQIIFFSLFLGFALIALGEKGEPVLNFFRAWTEAWKEITNIVLKFTPYGVFGLMANIVGKYGLNILLPYLKTIAACYITCILFTIFVQGGLMVGLYGRISPMKFFSTMKEAMLFVFATCSSVATIPLNLKCTKRLGVSDKIADFVVPFGAVMNMNGTAIYEAVAVVFASQVFTMLGFPCSPAAESIKAVNTLLST